MNVATALNRKYLLYTGVMLTSLCGGIAVQNMHAPYEVISKADLYETLKGYEAFLKNA